MKKLSAVIAIFLVISIFSVGSVSALWSYNGKYVGGYDTMFKVGVSEFEFFPEDMPESEVEFVKRLSDILNNKYATENIENSLDYLINETIQVYWGGNVYNDPYVGSMDKNFATQINELFQGVLFEEGVSFILKNQDLNGDGFKEITMYSTADPLDCVWEYDGVVCVYVTVFTPRIDENKNIVGYNLVCESLRGYCSEVYYDPNDHTPSFSTDEWRDDIGYWHYFANEAWRVPEDAMSNDWTTSYRLDYNSYNTTYMYQYNGENFWGSTLPYGRRLWECLLDKIPYLF